MISNSDLLTPGEVADLLQMHPSSIKTWVDDGRIQAFRTPGGHRRIRASDLVAFLVKYKMQLPAELKDTAKKLLIIDGDGEHLKSLGRSLKRFTDRVEVTTSSHYIDALVLAGSLRPHAVLLDANLTAVDALEVCRRLKDNAATSASTLFLYGKSFSPNLEQKALKAGAAKCLTKPIDPKNLIALMFD